MTSTKPPYYSVREMLRMIDEPNRSRLLHLYDENEQLFRTAHGSVHNHQAWPGGYHDHVSEIMNLAILIYNALLTTGRALGFTLSDVLLVLFLHDLEKPWKYRSNDRGELEVIPALRDKEAQQAFRMAKIAEYGIELSHIHENGLRYVEGEMSAYNERGRVSLPPTGFAHIMDVCSARVFHDYPLAESDPWAPSELVMRGKL